MHRFRLVILAIFALTIGCNHGRVYEILDRPGVEHVRISAGSALGSASGDTLLVRILVTNESSRDQAFMHLGCGTDPVAVSARSARRVWDSSVSARAPEAAKTYRDSTGRVELIGQVMCSEAVADLVPPGVSTHYDRRIPVRDILGDSLQSGRYKITARLYINSREIKGLPAGEVELRANPGSEGST